MSLRVSGSVILMCDIGRRVFFFQKKDHTHPRADCRGKLSLWGGQRLSNGRGDLEEPWDTLERRLRREWTDPLFSAAVLASIATRKPDSFFDLEHPDGHLYRLAVFVAAVPATEFKGWWRRFLKDGSVSHGEPACVHRSSLGNRSFVGQQEQIVEQLCAQYDKRSGGPQGPNVGRKLLTELTKISRNPHVR